MQRGGRLVTRLSTCNSNFAEATETDTQADRRWTRRRFRRSRRGSVSVGAAESLPPQLRFVAFGREVQPLSLDDKDVAEDYRRQRQAASARITGYKPRTLEEQLKWIDENKETLLELIRGAEPARPDDEDHLEAYRQAVKGASAGSEFDDVNLRATLDRLIREIEDACLEHGVPTHAGVAYGNDAILGLGIGQRAVLETEASIIDVSVHFLSFINQLSRLLSCTIPYRQIDEDQVFIGRDLPALRDILRHDTDLAHDWSEALTSFAAVGVQPQTPNTPLNDAQNAIRTMLLRAIELFAIGHEYGHHSMKHGRVTSSDEAAIDAFQDEFAADLFGRGCSMAICSKEEEENFYAVSGAGGVLILGALDLIRRVRAVLETGQDEPQPRSHHPPYAARVSNLAKLDANLHEANRQQAADYRQFFGELIEAVWERVKPIVLGYHKSGIRPKQDPDETTGWLPSRR